MGDISKKRTFRRNNGSILALVVIMVVIISILGLVMVNMGSSARVQAARASTDLAARAAADAGLTEAIHMMNLKLAKEVVWDNSTLPEAADIALPGADATYSYKITGDKNTGFAVTSIGRSAFSQRRVHNRLSIESFWFGIGVKQNVDILSKTVFATIPAGSDFTIRTNSITKDTIALFPNTEVPGDIIVGPGGDVDYAVGTKDSSIVHGDVYAAAEEIQFPDVVVPALPYKGALPVPSDPNNPGVIQLTAADSGIYDEIILAEGQKLHIKKDEVVIYVENGFRMHNSSQLLVKNNLSVPSLKLYVNGKMQADNGSTIITENHLDTGTRLKIFGTNECESIILMNSGDLSAAIYAPYASLEIKNSGALYGALTGDSLTMKNSGEFFFDVRLLDITIDEDMAYLVARWWEE
ncbi:MAG: DUF7305 domain-containing protein [Planctomycetota bacterium]|jgi:hypothetical protein